MKRNVGGTQLVDLITNEGASPVIFENDTADDVVYELKKGTFNKILKSYNRALLFGNIAVVYDNDPVTVNNAFGTAVPTTVTYTYDGDSVTEDCYHVKLYDLPFAITETDKLVIVGTGE